MGDFNEKDHIEMLEREVVYWKGQMQKAGEELAQALPRLTIFENATVENTGKIIELKKDLNERDKAYGDLKLQLMDKNDKHSEEMKELYGKLNQYQKQWETATATAKQERELKKHYSQKLDLSNRKINEWTEFAAELEDILMTTKRQKRHILRAFNDKADEVADLKRYIKQLERENSGLLESVTMLSSHAMSEIERGVSNKENENNENARLREALKFYAVGETYYPKDLEDLIPIVEDGGDIARQALCDGDVNEGVRKDVLHKVTPCNMPYALKHITRLYKTDFEIYNTSREECEGSDFKCIVFYTTDKPNISALGARIEKEYTDFFPQQEIEHTGTIVHDNPLFVLEKMSRGEVLNESIDKDMLIYRNAVILGIGFVYDGKPLHLFTFESLSGDENE